MSTERLSPNIYAPKAEELKDLIKKRGVLRGRLTVFAKYINALTAEDIKDNKKTELVLRLNGAESLLKDFHSIQNDIDFIVSENELFTQLEIREGFESSFYATMAQGKSLLPENSTSSSCSHTDVKVHAVKLPTIAVPTFEGAYEHWLEYRDTFTSLVHKNNNITPIQKYHYLKSSLKGIAALVIDSLEFTSDNYSVAWDLICNRFNNTRLLVHNHIKALFSIPNLTKESPTHIRKLIDTILKNLRALKLLNEPVDSWDTLIIYIVVSKLDSTTEREWEQFRGSLTTDAQSSSSGKTVSSVKVEHLINFLKDRADMLETLLVTHKQKVNKEGQVSKVHCHVSPVVNSQKSRFQSGSRGQSCIVCKKSHPIYACQEFIDLSVQDKVKFIEKNNLCSNCLRTGHSVNNCRFSSCRKCNKRHHTLIHSDQLITAAAATLSVAPELLSGDVSEQPTTFSHNAHSGSLVGGEDSSKVHPVLLSTALVEIPDNTGKYHVARALLDCGSERCFITQKLCDKLQVSTIQSTLQIKGVGNSVTQSTKSCDITIKAINNPFTMRLRCSVLPEITSAMPPIPIQSDSIKIHSNLTLADPIFCESRPIDILIGADKFWDLLCEGNMRLREGPFLQNTRLGWIVSGPIHSKISQSNNSVHCNFTQSIDTQLRSFWEIEELPKANNNLYSKEELLCEKHFVDNVKRTADGRFCVQIPFKQSPEILGDTHSIAESQFLSLEKRLQRNPTYKVMYKDFIQEYIDLGHMSKVDTYNKPHFFMPHHGVFREHSTTTKLRVVFNASQKSSTGVSLNELQLVGPAIQGDLLAILLRFRQHKYVACADIEKAYRQCLVDENQRDLQMILWRNEPADQLEAYQLNTVTYGTASAPFLTVRCLKQLGAECTNAEVAQIITNDFFVDDMITGSDSASHLLELCEYTKQVLASGCFPLRKWVYNFEINETRDQASHNDTTKDLSIGENVNCRTLGLGWFNKSDELHYHTQFPNDSKLITKRFILSSVSQIFDPLGLLSPTIMLGKILLQKLWLLKIDWDKPVPRDIASTWQQFEQSLSTLKDLRVPRQAIGSSPRVLELHIFTDASQVGYGACAYIRTINTDGSVTCRLLCSKGKVAPIKPISIPRLELCGAVLGAKLYTKIIESLRCNFSHISFWTDSTIVLGWLRMAPNLLKTFVQNRIGEIHDLTKEHPWRHISGKDNPADLVSRGAALDILSASCLWWGGPDFLCSPEFNCNQINSNDSPLAQELPEVKTKEIQACVVNTKTEFKFPFEKFSNLNRMIRGVARIKRFIYNKLHSDNLRTGPLAVDELDEALKLLIRFGQIESFHCTA